MTTSAARKSVQAAPDTVTSIARLREQGFTNSAIRAQVAAHRWQRLGRAIVRHNGPLTSAQRRDAARIVLGPRVLTTSFTALEEAGLRGWERTEIHLLVPRGARVVKPAELPIRVHYTDLWARVTLRRRGEVDDPVHAAVLAAVSLSNPRPACGILAAVVQQRLALPEQLERALAEARYVRHHRILTAAIADIGQGAHALSGIDFARLCRRHGLPEPKRQRIRRDPNGRRRYLDVEWLRADGRRVVVEIDGALHLAARRWWDDQLRQNEFAIAGDLVLRFPSVVVRTEEPLVVGQLRRAILL